MRQFLDIITEKHAYATMVDGFVNTFARHGIDIKGSWLVTSIENEMKWARQFLKREDRIVWYLRYARMAQIKSFYISEMMSGGLNIGGGVRELTPMQTALKSLWKDEQDRWQREMGYPFGDDVMPRGFLAHHVSMENQIASIRNYRWDRQSFSVLNRDLTELENQWKEQKKNEDRYLASGDDETIIDFGDGFKWVHLKRPSCDAEGKAMGHCGNAAAAKAGDTILSLRQTSDRSGFDKPELTFIRHRDGSLGEMKARFNEKPESKYHPYIIALLKNPIVKSVRGGGYASERNFSMNDLRQQDYDALVALKPSLVK